MNKNNMLFDTLPVKKVNLKKELQKQLKGQFISSTDEKLSLINKKKVIRGNI